MGLFRYCKCGHIEEEHAMDAPEGEQECLEDDCFCENFEPEDEPDWAGARHHPELDEPEPSEG